MVEEGGWGADKLEPHIPSALPFLTLLCPLPHTHTTQMPTSVCAEQSPFVLRPQPRCALLRPLLIPCRAQPCRLHRPPLASSPSAFQVDGAKERRLQGSGRWGESLGYVFALPLPTRLPGAHSSSRRSISYNFCCWKAPCPASGNSRNSGIGFLHLLLWALNSNSPPLLLISGCLTVLYDSLNPARPSEESHHPASSHWNSSEGQPSPPGWTHRTQGHSASLLSAALLWPQPVRAVGQTAALCPLWLHRCRSHKNQWKGNPESLYHTWEISHSARNCPGSSVVKLKEKGRGRVKVRGKVKERKKKKRKKGLHPGVNWWSLLSIPGPDDRWGARWARRSACQILR